MDLAGRPPQWTLEQTMTQGARVLKFQMNTLWTSGMATAIPSGDGVGAWMSQVPSPLVYQGGLPAPEGLMVHLLTIYCKNPKGRVVSRLSNSRNSHNGPQTHNSKGTHQVTHSSASTNRTTTEVEIDWWVPLGREGSGCPGEDGVGPSAQSVFTGPPDRALAGAASHGR